MRENELCFLNSYRCTVQEEDYTEEAYAHFSHKKNNKQFTVM